MVAGIGEGAHDQLELVKQVLAVHLVESHLKINRHVKVTLENSWSMLLNYCDTASSTKVSQ